MWKLLAGLAIGQEPLGAHLDAAENELQDEMDISLQSDGTRFGGKELSGLKLAVPTVTTTGTYGGINRATNATWRTFTYDANSFFTGQTQVTSTTIRPMLNQIVTARSRGKQGPDLMMMYHSITLLMMPQPWLSSALMMSSKFNRG